MSGALEASSTWLQQLASGRAYLAVAVAVAVAWALLRLGFESRSGGRRMLRTVHTLEGAFLALLLAGMIALSFLQILLRNLANTSFVWIDPLLRHMLLWVGFLGAMFAARIGRHINVDALSRFLSRPVLRGTRTLTNLLAACVCLLLSNACMHLVGQEAEFGRTGFLDVPLWIVQLVMPLATLGMSARFLGHALGTLLGRELAVDLHVPDVRPEVEAVRPGLRPEVRPGVRADVRSEVRSEVLPEVRPEVLPEVPPEVPPEVRP